MNLNPEDYVIAIPTFKRSLLIVKNTLNVLKNRNIDKNRIHLFVANIQEESEYLKNVPKNLYGKLIVGVIGLKNQRNFITKYFPENKLIVEMDDDVKEVFKLTPDKGSTKEEIKQNHKLIPLINLDNFFKDAFYRILQHDTSLKDTKYNWIQNGGVDKQAYIWGIYPVENPFFLSNTITDDLRFLVGPMWGKINRHSSDLLLKINEKEDFERTLRHYKKDGSVFRFNNVTIRTGYYSTAGGMQSENKDRFFESETSSNYLVNQFPHYVTKWYKGKDKRPEVRLKDKS
jgi:hypothetical protein